MNFTRKNLWRRFRFLTRAPQNVRLVWHLIWDKRVPAANKSLLMIIALLYLAIPTDILPDFLPVIGQIDDIGVILFLMDQFIRRAPAQVVAEYVKDN